MVYYIVRVPDGSGTLWLQFRPRNVPVLTPKKHVPETIPLEVDMSHERSDLSSGTLPNIVPAIYDHSDGHLDHLFTSTTWSILGAFLYLGTVITRLQRLPKGPELTRDPQIMCSERPQLSRTIGQGFTNVVLLAHAKLCQIHQ